LIIKGLEIVKTRRHDASPVFTRVCGDAMSEGETETQTTSGTQTTRPGEGSKKPRQGERETGNRYREPVTG
jgi:hypothetical protein